ncbi:MAG: dTMP kinase [Eggerthellaceae bacterium]|nr:dTMP kinase [Eggerthellaceae bacterium]
MVQSIQEHTNQGIFITFEGGDGAGKSTHINFLAEALRDAGYEVLCVREPGGTEIGEVLRDLVLNPDYENMAPETELLIYEAARAQIVYEVIKPALDRGYVVLCDRFYDSTVAYQAYGRGLDREFVRQANQFACQGLRPQRTVLIETNASAAEGLKRATHGRDGDRIERAGVAFHEAVNQAFRDIAAASPDRVRSVVSQPTKAETAKLVFAAVADLFAWDANSLPFTDDYFERANLIQQKRYVREH